MTTFESSIENSRYGYANPTSRESHDRKVHLTRRGKLFRTMGLVALAGLATFALEKPATAIFDALDKDYAYSATTHTEIAEPGEGLESIARRINTSGEVADLRDLEQHLKDTNPGLENGLQVSEGVEIPDSVQVN